MRKRVRRLFPVALSLEAARDALDGVSLRYLKDRIADGSLPAYSGPNRCVRVLVADLVALVRSWPDTIEHAVPDNPELDAVLAKQDRKLAVSLFFRDKLGCTAEQGEIASRALADSFTLVGAALMAAGGDQDVAVVPGILQFRQAIVRPWGGGIEFGRASHGECLVGAFGIELAHEGIELGLLLQAVHCWWPSGLLLQGQVHALMAAVLLRTAGLDALDGDAEAQPPDRQAGEIVEAVGTGEGQAIVASDRPRQAAIAEQLLEGFNDRGFAGRFGGLTQQQIARSMVGDRQGVTVAAIAELELALEVGAP